MISPDGLTALSNLQRLYSRQGRHAEAQGLKNQVEKYRDRNPYYHSWLAERAYEQGKEQDAGHHYKEAIDLKKNAREFYIGLSKSYERLGDSKAALRASSKAQTIDEPEDASFSVGQQSGE